MRAISFLVTIALLTAMVIYIKVLDNLYIAFGIMGVSALSGLLLYKLKRKGATSDIGYGIVVGSVIAILLLAVFILWLSYNFPK